MRQGPPPRPPPFAGAGEGGGRAPGEKKPGGGVLQDTGAIHHRVDAREMPGPLFGLTGAREVDLDPTQVGAALARRLDAATSAHDLMAIGDEPRDHGRSDETIGADDENPHD